jgi:hypothetical protein
MCLIDFNVLCLCSVRDSCTTRPPGTNPDHSQRPVGTNGGEQAPFTSGDALERMTAREKGMATATDGDARSPLLVG